MSEDLPKQIFTSLVQGTVRGRCEQGHTNSGGPAFVKFRIIHRIGYRRTGWNAGQPSRVTTVRVDLDGRPSRTTAPAGYRGRDGQGFAAA